MALHIPEPLKRRFKTGDTVRMRSESELRRMFEYSKPNVFFKNEEDLEAFCKHSGEFFLIVKPNDDRDYVVSNLFTKKEYVFPWYILDSYYVENVYIPYTQVIYKRDNGNWEPGIYKRNNYPEACHELIGDIKLDYNTQIELYSQYQRVVGDSFEIKRSIHSIFDDLSLVVNKNDKNDNEEKELYPEFLEVSYGEWMYFSNESYFDAEKVYIGQFAGFNYVENKIITRTKKEFQYCVRIDFLKGQDSLIHSHMFKVIEGRISRRHY